jgi:hypothetical protein
VQKASDVLISRLVNELYGDFAQGESG